MTWKRSENQERGRPTFYRTEPHESKGEPASQAIHPEESGDESPRSKNIRLFRGEDIVVLSARLVSRLGGRPFRAGQGRGLFAPIRRPSFKTSRDTRRRMIDAAKVIEEHGAAIAQAPRAEPWGQKTCRMISPGGSLLGFAETPWARKITKQIETATGNA